MDDSSYRDGESASCVLSEEETFRRIGTAVRVESVSVLLCGVVLHPVLERRDSVICSG